MDCLGLSSPCISLVQCLFRSKRRKRSESKQPYTAETEEKAAASYYSHRFVRNPLPDMPAGAPFPAGIAPSGSSKRHTVQTALRDSEIIHNIVSVSFAARYLSSLDNEPDFPEILIDSEGTEYHVKGYFYGNWTLLKTYKTNHGHFAVTADPLPQNVDALLAVKEADLGRQQASAEEDHIHALFEGHQNQQQREAAERDRAAQIKAQKDRTATTRADNRGKWAQSLKPKDTDPKLGKAASQ